MCQPGSAVRKRTRFLFIKSTFSLAALSAASVHVLEDVALISIGKFIPGPWWLAYLIGIGLSWLVLSAIIYQVKGQNSPECTHS
jgi:hypothetical protein